VKRVIEFFKKQLIVAHIKGIPIRIDYRWFLFLAVLAWLTARSIPPTLVENQVAAYTLGLITTVVFFFSIFLHELGHAIVARREGIRVLEILLHPFGGLTRLSREPDSPGVEFRIAIAGPIASFLVAFAFLGLFAGSNYLGTGILSPLFFLLFFLNLLLAIFNLFPGYPLDGGRVVRAILWHRGTDLNEATVLTGKFGQIIGISLIVFGSVVALINRDLFTGLWTVIVGLFLYDAAAGIIRQVQNFENRTVEDLMELPVSVEPEISIMQFVDRFLPLHRQIVFPVAEAKQLYGFMLLDDVKRRLPREEWNRTLVRDVMRPIREDYFVESGCSIVEAKELIRLNGIGSLGIIDEQGKLIGLLRKSRIK